MIFLKFVFILRLPMCLAMRASSVVIYVHKAHDLIGLAIVCGRILPSAIYFIRERRTMRIHSLTFVCEWFVVVLASDWICHL
jgi:hypothetical protein